MVGIGCRSVQRRIERSLDGGGGAAPRDTLHLARCPRCRRRYQAYSSFRTSFRTGAQIALAGLGEPDWERLLLAGRRGAQRSGVEGRLLVLPPGPKRRILPIRATAAAAVVVFLTVGGLVGYRQYREAEAHALVREQTAAFVNALFSQPFFPEVPSAANDFNALDAGGLASPQLPSDQPGSSPSVSLSPSSPNATR